MMKTNDKIVGGLLAVALFAMLPFMPVATLAQTKGGEPTEKTVSEQEVQFVIVSGKILDSYTHEPLAGVKVRAFNSNRYSAMTGEDGTYSIKVPRYVSSLLLSCEGFNSVQLPVKHSGKGVTVDSHDAVLYSNAFSADYSESEESSLKRVAAINSNNCDVSIDEQIGTALGAQIRSMLRSGVPGSGSYMLMNGINSLNSNAQPLIVLDGMIMDMQYDAHSIHDGFFNNILANISVDDIRKVTLLRNGTALYGAKGANGVVLIDTKRNRSMATKIDLSIAGKYQMLPNQPDMMDAGQYRNYVSELLGTTDTKLVDFKFLRDEKDYYYYDIYHNNTDWTKEVYDESFAQSYGINVQGGDEIANYNLSVGYMLADATIKDNDYSRFNLRLNSDINLLKNLTVRFDAAYSDVNRDMRDDGAMDNITDNTITAPGFLSLVKSPFLSPYAYDTQGNISTFLAGADDYLDEVLGEEASLSNPLSILRNGEADNKNSFGNRLITLAIAPKLELSKHLSLTERFSFLMTNTDENYYLPVTGVPSFEIEGIGTVNNMVQSLASHQYLTTSDTRLDWQMERNALKLNLSGGFRYTLSDYELNSMKGYNSGNDKSPNMTSGLSYKTTDGVDRKVTTLTYYLLGDLAYKDCYLFNAGVSMEASSLFGKDAEGGIDLCGVVWGLFPSVGASWIISNENWFNRNNTVNYLKLSGGFDVTGNDDINLLASRTYFMASRLLNAADGLAVGNIGNTTLKWETTKRATLGLDMNMFNNRLSFSANFFKSLTSDLLSMQKLPYVIGLDENSTNGGKLENIGFDATLCVKALNLHNFKWEVGASVGHYTNEVTALPGGDKSYTTDLYNASIITRVGSPVGLFYGYKTNGVYADSKSAQQDGLYRVSSTGSKQYFGAGDVRFVNSDNSNGNLEINENDRVVIGDPNPDVYGNIFTNMKYRNWKLNLVFNYSLGNDVYNYARSILEGGSYFYNQTTALGRRWTTEGQVTDIPKISYEDEMGNSRFSDRWIEDGSYLRLKTITLSYDFPINNRYIQGLTVWGSANNLLTLTKYLGSDPEFSAGNSILMQGIDRGCLASSRNFSIGIKMNL